MIEETKHDRFKRLAENRTKKVLHQIELLENLISENYESDVKERNKIVTAIEEQVNKLKTVYSMQIDTSKEFKL